MERDTHLSKSESDKDKDSSTRKKKVILPRSAFGEQDVQRQVAAQLEPFLRGELDIDGGEKKKRKRKRKKKSGTAAREATAETDASADRAEDREAQRSESKKPETTTETPSIADIPMQRKSPETIDEHEKESKQEPEFLGVLPVSDRAIRELEALKAEQSDSNEGVSEDQSERTETVAADQSETPNEEPEKPNQSVAPRPVYAQSNQNNSGTPPSPQKPYSSPAPTASAAVPPPPAPGGGSGNRGNTPPPPPVSPGNPYGPGSYPNPNVSPMYSQYNAAPTPPVGPPRPPERRVEYRGEPRGSLLTGLLVGALVEHIRHKGKERRQEKAHEKVLTDYRKERTAETTRQRSREEATQRKTTALEQQLARLQNNTAPAQNTERPYDVAPTPTRGQEVMPKHVSKEQETPDARAAREKIEQAIRAEAAKNNPEEQPEIPKDRRVEHSAWHRIEVDKKTGRTVEDPTIAYGEEFKKEQHQEQLRREVEEASMDSESIRQTYVVPKTEQQKTSSQSAPNAQTSQPDKKPAKDVATSVSPSLVMDIVLWIVLAVIVFAIVSLL